MSLEVHLLRKEVDDLKRVVGRLEERLKRLDNATSVVVAMLLKSQGNESSLDALTEAMGNDAVDFGVLAELVDGRISIAVYVTENKMW
jgi:hypothetical protein